MIYTGIPTQTILTFWVPTKLASDPSAQLLGGAHSLEKKPLTLKNGQTVAFHFIATKLTPDTEYEFQLLDSNGKVIQSKKNRTLPGTLEVGKSFTVSLGSCFWYPSDSTKVLPTNYPPKAEDYPDINLLVGDQVYIDVTDASGWPDILSAAPPEAYAIYARQWDDPCFQKFLAAIPTGMLPDDHEFWNDYPHGDVYLKYLGVPQSKAKLETETKDAFNIYQKPLNVGQQTTFEFAVDPLSFLVLDTRTQRTRYDSNNPTFLDPNGVLLAKVISWIQSLKGPGVLVLGGALVDEKDSWFERTFHTMGDVSLADYEKDFFSIWDALARSKHDVLLLAGDIHYGRFGYVDITKWPGYVQSGERVGRVYECISSALCLLTTAKGEYKHGANYKFDIENPQGMDGRLEYVNAFATKKGDENFAIIRFTRIADGIEFTIHFYEIARPTSQYKSEYFLKCILK